MLAVSDMPTGKTLPLDAAAVVAKPLIELSHVGVTFPTKTDLSEAMSKALKKRGFKFVGPVIVYAWMQAVGIVNDHAADCFRR